MPCGSPRCPKCGAYQALINCGMVFLTSQRMGNPSSVAVLTTKDPEGAIERWSKDVEQVFRGLKRRWPHVERLGFMEWTTGLARSSGGKRRPHMHLLLRGLPRGEEQAAEQKVREIWERRTGANRVEVETLRETECGIRYLALHHGKLEQAPPAGWSGRAMRPSRGWYGTPAEEVRAAATAQLRQRSTRKKVRDRLRQELEDSGADMGDVPDEIWDAWEDAGRRAEEENRATPVRLDRPPVDFGLLKLRAEAGRRAAARRAREATDGA